MSLLDLIRSLLMLNFHVQNFFFNSLTEPLLKTRPLIYRSFHKEIVSPHIITLKMVKRKTIPDWGMKSDGFLPQILSSTLKFIINLYTTYWISAHDLHISTNHSSTPFFVTTISSLTMEHRFSSTLGKQPVSTASRRPSFLVLSCLCSQSMMMLRI